MKSLRYLRDAAVFAPCYLALDWASHVYPLGPFNITPWNPQSALAIVWMLLAGLRFAPAVAVTIFAADWIVRGGPGGYAVTAATALTLACGYGAIARLLQVLLGSAPVVRTTRQLTLFAATAACGTALVGAAFIAVLRLSGFLQQTPLAEAWLRFWMGDCVGVLVTAPLLLSAADEEARRAFFNVAKRSETMLQAAVLVATSWLVFSGLQADPARHFYLLFLPTIWLAIRGGLSGALIAVTIVQLGVVIGIRDVTTPTPPVVDLQAFVAALTLTALYLGVAVDERERAADGLRESLRLAAAGEMAGAVAHEVNQPLTALAYYGRSAQLLMAQGGTALDQLPHVIECMLAEGQRAGEVVRRLRDFFRTGTTHLEAVPIDQVLAAARNIARQVAGDRPVAIQVESSETLPALLVDRLQVELVLRNLIGNAIEATSNQPSGSEITVIAQRHDAQHVRFVVADNGPGVAAGVRRRLFEPFASDKPSGMGLGLAVSRAIAEAHGGSLDARPSTHGEFHLVLPCGENI